MRLALVCPYAWDEAGGVQVHVRELGERLRERGHEVLGLTPSRSVPSQPWVRRVGGVIALPYGGSLAPVSPWPSTRARVRHELRQFGPELVHVHEPFAPSASLFALGCSAAPVVASFHSGLDRSRLYDAAGPWFRSRARRIAVGVAVSTRAADVARRRLGGTYRVIPNGIDVSRFERAEPADLGPGTKLLFVGRLHPRKGFASAVVAFGRLAATRSDLRLVVAGSGEERDAVANLPRELQDRVTMLGSVPHDELPPILAGCDLFVAPNTGGESFGLVLVEAMAAGLPVVASDIPGYDEVVTDGIDGVLVPPRDAVALSAAISRVLNDPILAARLQQAGRGKAARCDWSVVVEALEACYRDGVEAGSRRLR